MTKLTLPALYAIINVNEQNNSENYFELEGSLLLDALKTSMPLIQLRCKNLKDKQIEGLVEKVCAYRKDFASNSLVFLNDYVLIAKKYNLDGVHLGQDDFSPQKAREICGENFFIGWSCHNLKELEAAPNEILDYVACGPIYNSTTKINHAPVVGVENLKLFCEKSLLPVVAIGGISINNAAPIFQAGAASCAVISELKKYQSVKLLLEKFCSLKSQILIS